MGLKWNRFWDGSILQASSDLLSFASIHVANSVSRVCASIAQGQLPLLVSLYLDDLMLQARSWNKTPFQDNARGGTCRGCLRMQGTA